MPLKEIIVNLFREVFGSPSVDVAVIQKYFDPAYTQNVDGTSIDHRGLIEHLRKQRQVIDHMSVEFLAMAEEGDTVFTNHVVTATKKDGSELRVKVMAQFTIRNGRLIGCDELTRLLSGAEEDRDMGSRH